MRHECPDCETVFLHADRCPGCGWSAVKSAKIAPKVPETQQPWTPPTYPVPEPGDEALIRAEMARCRTLLGIAAAAGRRDEDPLQPPSRLGLAIDPAIRSDLARRTATAPVALAAVVPAVLATTRRKAER